MSPLQIGLLVALVVWNLVSAIAIVALLRQVTLLSARLGELDQREEIPSLLVGLSLDSGFEPFESGNPDAVTYFFWLTSTCGTCLEFSAALAQAIEQGDWDERSVVLLTGSGPGRDAIKAQLSPLLTVVLDPESSQLVEALGLDRSPFVVETQAGVITGWASIRELEDIMTLRDARSYSNAQDYATSPPSA